MSFRPHGMSCNGSVLLQDVEAGKSPLIAAHHLPVDQAGPHLEVVHGLDHEREAVRPVIAAPGNEPDANGTPRP